ncbi:hypothetical protein [Erwinia pyrifoliae]|uniref:Morphogenetic protein n=1 Tax=Erwinia pyrifoliae TaxID=79967 RepID=A0ABY5X3M3_ERWPY|nr:hypothetical protein [Erwinia pyrifoliae]MCT2388756.1 hypothetical protein [Erwinia pyrifoliae]MCU8586925.1 hypothetical protein [Erwinia pyrifoliae]UWS30795.1 hypothetical protein NYP81_04845 [Erwinia pyrifoliae]UWS31979.1 hypothetical protein NYP84_09835 [Erwinia pyrifoliae]UXK13809.1 hypothetical protein NYP80_08420 [Erwinia pyrifoliae]
MRERPIIFNAEMVRAVLDGSKTQTRRIIKNQRIGDEWSVKPAQNPRSPRHTHDWWLPHGTQPYSAIPANPFGAVGDRLWVRETWAILGNEDRCAIDWNENLVKGGGPEAARIYRASCEQRPGNYGLWSIPDDAVWKPHTDDMQYEGAWTPSIHMPRWASRITLEITGVRVERLHEISARDVIKEGLAHNAKEDYSWLWESIYGEGSWQANPWVWVVEFKRVEDAK